jgi:hypothetical protein
MLSAFSGHFSEPVTQMAVALAKEAGSGEQGDSLLVASEVALSGCEHRLDRSRGKKAGIGTLAGAGAGPRLPPTKRGSCPYKSSRNRVVVYDAYF